MPRLKSLIDYWREWPPVHQLVALYLDYKPAAEREQTRNADLEALMASAPPLPDHMKLKVPHG